MTESAAKSLAVMRNPFSTLTAAPKIPDGSVPSSLTLRDVQSRQFFTDTGTATFVLTPGFQNYFSYMDAEGNQIHCPIIDIQRNVVLNEIGQNQIGYRCSHNCPNGWRVVSSGLRLTLLNNTDSNDGWFEAIRINPSYDDNDLNCIAIQKKPGNVLVDDEVYFAADVEDFENQTSLTGVNLFNWANHPSYITGKLRDIHKYTFMLKSLSEEHPFTRMEEQDQVVISNFEEGSDTTSPHAQVKRWAGGTCPFYDKCCDTLLIRCHFRPDTLVYMHAHAIQFTEGVHDSQSSYARYHTGCPSAKRMLESTIDYLNKDPKPGYMRIPKAPIKYKSKKY